MRLGKCPSCKQNKFEEKDTGHRECRNCGAVGWAVQTPIKEVGKGKGLTCPWCSQGGLQVVAEKSGYRLRRCTVCLYTLIEPPATA